MPNEVMQGVDIATNAYKRLNARTAVLLYENTNAGIGNAKVFGDTFKSLGGQILADIGFGRDVNDFTRSRRASPVSQGGCDPDLHARGPGLAHHASAGAGWRHQGWRRTIDPARHDLVTLRFEQKAGKAALGYVRIVQFDPTDKREWCRTSFAPSRPNTIRNRRTFNAHAFDQILVIADVVRRGGKDSQSIRDIMATTKDFSGVTGSVEFDKTNQNIKMDTIHYMETLPDLSWKALGWN